MNGSVNNNDYSHKQINRVATPIQLDNNGNVVNQNNVKKTVKVVKEHDSSTMVFVVVMLIILAVVCAFAFFYVVPRLMDEDKTNNGFNDAEPTTESIIKPINNTITKYTLNGGETLNTSGDYIVNDKFQLQLSGDEIITISVNGKEVSNSKSVLANVGVVDDILLFVTQDNVFRTTKLLGVTVDGEKVLEIYTVTEGMALLPDINSVVFNNASLVIMTSRVLNKNLILDNEYGSITGINLCNNEVLLENKIDGKFNVMANYSIEYLGNHKFSVPKVINAVSLNDYKETSRVCY